MRSRTVGLALRMATFRSSAVASSAWITRPSDREVDQRLEFCLRRGVLLCRLATRGVGGNPHPLHRVTAGTLSELELTGPFHRQGRGPTDPSISRGTETRP